MSSEGSPTRSERSSTEYTWPASSSDGSHSHYRGITFDDILSPDMITSAPPPVPDAAAGGGKQKRRRHSKAASSSSSESSTMEQPRSPGSMRNYPSSPEKKLSSAGRMHATARAFVRGLSVMKVKRDSHRRSASKYGAVEPWVS